MPLEPKIPFASKEWSAFAHVVNMVRETRVHQTTPKDDVTIRNALTESAMIHRRVLIEAMIAEARWKPDDIILRDILADPLPDAVGRAARALEAAYDSAIATADGTFSPKGAMDKLLAHLTTLRGARFNFTPHMKVVDPLIHAVLAAIDHEFSTHFATGFIFLGEGVERSTQLTGATVVTKML